MLSTTASYAIRALSCLAASTDDRPVLGRDLAEMAEVPANYLAKILLVLKRAGLVEATRGTGGGYRLGRAPTEIALLEIVELIDPHGGLHGCLLDGNRKCTDATACPAHEGWTAVRKAYTAFLETTTLDQVAPTREAPKASRGRNERVSGGGDGDD